MSKKDDQITTYEPFSVREGDAEVYLGQDITGGTREDYQDVLANMVGNSYDEANSVIKKNPVGKGFRYEIVDPENFYGVVEEVAERKDLLGDLKVFFGDKVKESKVKIKQALQCTGIMGALTAASVQMAKWGIQDYNNFTSKFPNEIYEGIGGWPALMAPFFVFGTALGVYSTIKGLKTAHNAKSLGNETEIAEGQVEQVEQMLSTAEAGAIFNEQRTNAEKTARQRMFNEFTSTTEGR